MVHIIARLCVFEVVNVTVTGSDHEELATRAPKDPRHVALFMQCNHSVYCATSFIHSCQGSIRTGRRGTYR